MGKVTLCICLLLWCERLEGYLISSSRLDACNVADLPLNCTTSKLVVTLSVDNNQLPGTETIEAYITSVTSQTDSEAPLQFPIKVTASKSLVSARYPLRYQRDFNNKVRELVLSQSTFECTAEAYASNPTCGWKRDTKGEKIWDSQGYCCACSVMQTLGLDTDSYTRGNQCQAFNLGEGYATAHCLLMDDLWYSAYEIGSFSTSYEISVEITVPDINGNYSLAEMRLSPSVPVRNAVGIVGRLVGDFYPNTPPPGLNERLLFTPSSPEQNYRVLMGSRRWMVVDKTKVTYDGTDCNKIGTSYSAFNNQPNKCAQRVQSCFQNQLDDFDSSDSKLLTDGRTPLYFLSAFGNFSYILNGDEKYLQLNMEGRFASVITLEMSADRLVFLTSVSTGRIDYAFINSFESLTYDGMLTCQVTSTGAVVAQFSLTVNCTDGIAPIESALFSLPPHRSIIRTFPINTEKLTGQTYNCSVNLWNAIGDLLETVTIAFNTTSRHTDLGSQGGSGETPSGDLGSNETRKELSCADFCPNWLDLPCFFVKGCWSSFLRFLGILVFIAALLLTAKFVIRRYGICCQRLCKFSRKPNSQPESPQTRTSRRKEPSPVKQGTVYYNFHYGIPEFSLYHQFSTKGYLSPTETGEYDFQFQDSAFRLYLQQRNPQKEAVLRLSPDEVFTNISEEPMYGEFQDGAEERTDIER